MAWQLGYHLRRAALRDGEPLGDGERLGGFIERHDGAALAALVKRHGPMVWGVCGRLPYHLLTPCLDGSAIAGDHRLAAAAFALPASACQDAPLLTTEVSSGSS